MGDVGYVNQFDLGGYFIIMYMFKYQVYVIYIW